MNLSKAVAMATAHPYVRTIFYMDVPLGNGIGANVGTEIPL